MLDLSSIDLEMLVMAIEDHSYESSWWVDPATGAVEYCPVDEDPEELESRGPYMYIRGTLGRPTGTWSISPPRR